MVLLVVWPTSASPELLKVAMTGALLGLFAYGTYDLTNLATLKGWPVFLSILDMAWGTAETSVSAVAGRLVIQSWPAG